MQRPLIRIVDDDKALAESFGLLLETMGWDTAAYTSGRRFLNNDDLSRPGCIVLDVRMPGLTGPEIQDKLIEMGCRLPIIFLSAHGSIPMAVSTVQKGAVDFLEKPIEPAELIAKINAAVARSVTETAFARASRRSPPANARSSAKSSRATAARPTSRSPERSTLN